MHLHKEKTRLISGEFNEMLPKSIIKMNKKCCGDSVLSRYRMERDSQNNLANHCFSCEFANTILEINLCNFCLLFVVVSLLNSRLYYNRFQMISLLHLFIKLSST